MNAEDARAILKHWERRTTDGILPVYDGGCGALGVPTLSTMSLLAKVLDVEVRHYGYGTFGATRAGVQILSFDGGGAMETLNRVSPAGHGNLEHRSAQIKVERIASYSYFTGTEEAYLALLRLVGTGEHMLNEAGRAGVERVVKHLFPKAIV